jgi:subtilisin family serine protease
MLAIQTVEGTMKLEGRWFRKYAGLSALAFLLLPAQILYASGGTCPDVQRDGFIDRLRLSPPGRMQASPVQKPNQPRFAGDRIIVKFKDSLTEPADLVHAAGLLFAQAAPAGGGELDELNALWGVRKITPLFQLGGGQGSRQTITERKDSFTRLFERSRAKYARRAARASAAGAIPDLSRVYILSLPGGTDIKAACRSYSANPAVEYAVPSSMMQPQSVADDPYFSSRGSWGNSVDDMWALKRIRADIAWDTAQGEGVVVAVVDTGLDYNHVDIAANVWSNPLEAAGTPNVDDDGNGFTDDVRGWHFDYPQSYNEPYVSNNDVIDSTGHGTFVAGIIAAVGNNGTGIVGVAPRAKIMPVKAYSSSWGISSGADPDSPFANAILYAAYNGADVINLSWGCSDCFDSPTIRDAVTVANALGAIVVASAGDRASDVRDAFPAMIQDLVTVSSSDVNDDHSLYSNRGFFVDVAAPGGNSGLSWNNAPDLVSILSLAGAQQMLPESSIVAPGYVRSAGTSASAAYVSGVAALVLSANPSLTREQVISIIRHSADDQVGNPAKDSPGYDPYLGWGRVNAARAVAMAASPPSDPPEIRTQPAGLSFVVPRLLCQQDRLFSFDIFNVGGGTLNWTLAAPPWITPSATSGTAFASPVMTLNATESVSGAITVSSNGGAVQFPVSLAVQPDITLSNCSMPITAGVWDADRNINPPGIPDGAGGAYYVSYDVLQYHPDMSIQHIDSNGTPLWTANGLRVSSSTRSKHGPAIISDGFGGAIVLWIEDNNTMEHGDDNIRMQRISSAGELLWGSAGIDITQGGSAADPVIIPDGSGGAIVGWYSVSDYKIRVQRVSASGALLWGSNGIQVSQATDGQSDLALAGDGSGGAFLSWTGSAWWTVYGQHVTGDGALLWEATGKRLSAAANDYTSAYGANVVSDGAGGAIFAWHDLRNYRLYPEDNSVNRNDIYAVCLNGAGQHLWDPAGVPVVSGFRAMPGRISPSGGPYRLNMLGDGQGGAIMAWHDLRNRETTVHGKWDIYAQRLNPAGEPVWGPDGIPVIAADGKQDAPTIIPDGDGGALFAWHDDRSGNFDIFIQHLKANGSFRWGSPGVWVHSGSQDQVNPFMIHLGGNRLAISWNEGYYGFNGEMVQLCTDHDGDGLYAEGGVCGAVNGTDPVLTVTRAGTGSGSVQSLPSGIDCGPDCSRRFAPGTVVSLTAVAAPNAQFSGWTGGCSGTGGCSVTLGADTTVQANFTAVLPVKIAENWPSTYGSPQQAYNNALNGQTIISMAHNFSQNLDLNLPVAVRIEGGYDEDFVGRGSYTEIQGSVTITNGTATLDNIVIK